MGQFLQLLVNGLVAGSVLALGAVGVTLVYGVLRVVNFAHGDYLTVGAYAAFVVSSSLGLGLILGTIAAILVTALLAAILELILWRPLRRRRAGTLSLFLGAIGLALILRQLILVIMGSDAKSLPIDAYAVHVIGPLRLGTAAIIALVLAAAGNISVGLFLRYTRLGKSMRAYSDNPVLAGVSGIDTQRLIMTAWIIAGGLAGLAGVLQALVQASFDPNMGWGLLLPIFAAVVLGTIGNAYGALVGGLVLGVVMSLSTWDVLWGGVPAQYTQLVAFAALALLLLIRPEGLFSRPGKA